MSPLPVVVPTGAQQFQAFRDEASSCHACVDEKVLEQAHPLFQRETTFAQRILFVAEAPNPECIGKGYIGLPAPGDLPDESDRQVTRMLEAVGLHPGDVLFTNAVLCLPPEKDGKYPVAAAQRKLCGQWLAKAIENMDAKVIVTLGSVPLEALRQLAPAHGLQLASDVGRLHDWHGRLLLPLYHPSQLGQMMRGRECGGDGRAQQVEDFKAIRAAL